MAYKRSNSAPVFSLSSSPNTQHSVAVGIAGIAVAARCYVAWRAHFTADDALITLRYAQNVASGSGFVYAAGKHVLGLPGPLYALLLSIFSSSANTTNHVDVMLVGKAFNIAAEGVTCYLLARLMARTEIARPVEGLFAASLYALSSTPIRVSISGIETSLITCVGLAMIYAYVARRSYWLYALGSVLFLLTFEGILLFIILAAALAVGERKLPLRPGAIALIIVIPWLIFATLYFGSPLPDTLTTGSEGNASASHVTIVGNGEQANLAAFTAQFASGWISFAMTLLFALGAILVVCQAVSRAERGVLAAPLIWCMAYAGMLAYLPIGLKPSALVPVMPSYIVIASLAGATAPIKFGKMRPELTAKWAEIAVPGSLGLLMLFGIGHLPAIVHEIGVQRARHASAPRISLSPFDVRIKQNDLLRKELPPFKAQCVIDLTVTSQI